MKLRERRLDAVAQLDGARRAMRASFQRELDVIESNLSFLASVGSVSPYVGLFGTVWGIMHAFVGLSNMQQVTLATVAPGIAEALVATAHRPVRGDSRGHRVQPAVARTSTASRSSWRPSSRSSPTSCSAAPASRRARRHRVTRMELHWVLSERSVPSAGRVRRSGPAFSGPRSRGAADGRAANGLERRHRITAVSATANGACARRPEPPDQDLKRHAASTPPSPHIARRTVEPLTCPP